MHTLKGQSLTAWGIILGHPLDKFVSNSGNSGKGIRLECEHLPIMKITIHRKYNNVNKYIPIIFVDKRKLMTVIVNIYERHIIFINC